ncbi:serine/threonine-protein kinase [Roseimaritima sediminicola]|uniref:serine/threonine-protein kinase n=1 Tax=Roseimaritima sediminicola TaxID=2662066 RepID=UPI0012985555|nr:serine/threonine-protein kinase [Roseimaritima sediminicola]
MTDQYLGPYRLQSKLGSGGMGSVFRAVHAKTGEKVAVKLIAERVADSERFRRRFSVEVETLKKLNHPNIVRLIGYGEEHGRLFYSMDIVEGPSLQQHLKQHKRLGWQETLRYGIDICAALKHAHDLGIIHRDLKPANLLIHPEGRIQLVDFGIAKMFGAGDYTAAGSVLGTADYMAPEQAGDGKITARTDLYALGSVLYACLAGRPPFGGKSITTVIEALRRETPVDLDLIVPETPEELTELVHHLLEKRPQDRPPTALVVGNRLRAMLRGLEAREAQTDADHSGGTKVDDPTDNTDLEIDDQYVVRDDTAVAPGPGTRFQPNSGTDQACTLDATIASAPQSVPRRPPTEPSMMPDSASEPMAAKDTSFRTVDESERRRSVLAGSTDDQHPLLQWLSILGLSLLLVAIVAATIYLLRPPTADDLFASIQAAEAVGDTPSSKRDVEQFLKRYPDDPRAGQVRQIADSLDVETTIRRLRLEAFRAGGVAQLPPPEQAFLEAALLRDRDPAAARQQLEHWLAIYGREGLPRSPQTKRLAALAESELQSLADAPAEPTAARGDDLNASLRWASENLPEDQRREFYDAVVALYADKPWAADAVAVAKAALERMQAPASP